MASMVIGGLFNAVAFAGAGFIFSKLNKHGYETEIKRHNTAMEQLSRDKEKFYETQAIIRNKEAKLRYEIIEAKSDIRKTNSAFLELYKVQETLKKHSKKTPVIQDYYEPSPEMKKYKKISAGVMGTTAALLLSRVI